ncbi:hypothetical protein NEIMUCOT_05802 [Neisseria mucosa ATCC 25996]|uniref:Uncharacterized protein n=1 Tax=Neisseria mucosa (strain ATCC 25996 / DSM 4631 / NCTC 10774 / M26) TaxID=546266 RepID=D2ZYT7_NEIM2|nr:hypothetical protein NEIMUCOT_05802 [Neisseria mucosa ATCC 25996]
MRAKPTPYRSTSIAVCYAPSDQNFEKSLHLRKKLFSYSEFMSD